MTTIFGAQGVYPSLRGQATNVFSLEPGQARIIPAGTWDVNCGPYTCVQEYDPITTIWRAFGGDNSAFKYVNSDGVNYRVVNAAGCMVGAYGLNGGSGYSTANPPSVTTNAGSQTIVPIIGGAVSTSVTVANGGAGYLYPPVAMFDAPPTQGVQPGVQATGYATLTNGAVTSITVTNQGAGYTSAPNITFINDPRDLVGTNAVATATLTGGTNLNGSVTALLVTNFGNSVASTVVPTITVSGGAGTGATATAVMMWGATAYTVTSAGSGYAGNVLVTTAGTGAPTATQSFVNPAISTGLVRGRQAQILASVATAAITATGQTVFDGGVFAGIPTGIVAGFASGTAASAAQVSFALGAPTTSDTVVLLAV